MSEETEISVSVSCRMQDNGDGGFSVHLYSDDEALLADHDLVEDGLPPTPEQRRIILGEDDPYENGYISHESIDLIKVNGVWKLKDGQYMHFGQ